MNSLAKVSPFAFLDNFTNFERGLLDTNFSLVDNMLDTFFDGAVSTHLPYNTVVVDENTYRIELALAGFKKDDISVTIDNDRLEVSSKAEEKVTEGTKPEYPKYVHKGISKRTFNAAFTLPKNAEVDAPEFKDGLLTITINRPKQEASRPVTLKIK